VLLFIEDAKLRALVVAASPATMTRFCPEPFDAAEAAVGVQRSLELDAICVQLSADSFTLLRIVGHGRGIPDGESMIFLARDHSCRGRPSHHHPADRAPGRSPRRASCSRRVGCWPSLARSASTTSSLRLGSRPGRARRPFHWGPRSSSARSRRRRGMAWSCTSLTGHRC
jgi:hypothetical protein